MPSTTRTALLAVSCVPVSVPVAKLAATPLFAPSVVPDTASSVPVEAEFAVRRIAPVPVYTAEPRFASMTRPVCSVVALMPRIVPAVVLFADRFTSVPVKLPVLWMFTALPLNAAVPVSTLNSVPVVVAAFVFATFTSVPVVRPEVATFTPDVAPLPDDVPAPAVKVLPLETVVLPTVVLPVNVLLPPID